MTHEAAMLLAGSHIWPGLDHGEHPQQSYSFILDTTGDGRIFGTDLILTTVELAKMIQNSLQVVRFRQDKGYDSQYGSEPRGHASSNPMQ